MRNNYVVDVGADGRSMVLNRRKKNTFTTNIDNSTTSNPHNTLLEKTSTKSHSHVLFWCDHPSHRASPEFYPPASRAGLAFGPCCLIRGIFPPSPTSAARDTGSLL